MNGITIDDAVALLRKGELVVIPTETVYGLAANIYDEQAIRKVFDTKQRPLYNPLIVHLKSIDDLPAIAKEIPDKALLLARHFWPGPLTLVLKKSATVSDLITGGKDSVAVRVPNHPVALELLQKTGFPVAAPSANPFNYLSPTTTDDVRKALPQLANQILEGGACQRGIESTVVGFDKGGVHLYRHGAIPKEEIEAILGEKLSENTHHTAPTAPGMLSKHYSPKSKLIITQDVLQAVDQTNSLNVGVLSFEEKYRHPAIQQQMILSEKGDLREAARNFFAALYKLDSLQLEYIVAELLPNEGLGIAINDRLQRGATKLEK